MLKNIKSNNILKKIFVHIIDRNKFKLIVHNKNIQNILNIDIIDFRLFSGKYIKYDEKGIIKEYNSTNDNLIYEGEYLNGKRHGKGKEYNFDGKLLFEGDYLNGKRV